MNRMDFSKLFSNLANVGVIAGIIFLGIEMRQNNDLLQLQAETAGMERNTTMLELLLENPDVLIATRKAPEDLTELEYYQLDTLVQRVLTAWQTSYKNYRQGSLREIPSKAFSCTWNGPLKPHFERRWGEIQRFFDDAFVHYLEDSVIDEENC